MEKARNFFLHLALVGAGWGIVTVIGPRLATFSASGEEEMLSAPTKTGRPRVDHAGGQRLLASIAREVKIPEPPEPEPKDERPFEERVAQIISEMVERSLWLTAPTQPDDIYLLQPRKSLDEIRDECRRAVLVRDIAPIVRGTNGPELSYAFRHGRIEAREILGQLASRLPEQAADPSFPLALYQIIAEENPRLAEPLLAELSGAEKSRERWIFSVDSYGSDPDLLFAMHSASGEMDEARNQSTRRERWRHAAANNSGENRADYLAWLEALPRGRERDFAISGALLQSSRTEQESIEYLRPLIDDPEIREWR